MLFLSVLLSAIETVGISAIMPFISVASNPAIIEKKQYYKTIYDFFDFKNSSRFIITFGFLLIGFYVFRAAVNIFYIYLLNRFSFSRFHHFAYRLFKTYVAMPYSEFISKNSSVLTEKITGETSTLSAFIQHVLFFLSEIFTFTFLYLLLLVVNWKMTLILTIILSLKVLFITAITSNIIKKQGSERYEVQNRYFKIINETFRNLKIIKILANEKKIFEDFNKACSGYSKANITTATLTAMPRSVLETVGFSLLIVFVIYVIYRESNVMSVIPIISIYALALYRMLPSINRILSSYNNIIFASKALDVIYMDLTYTVEEEGDVKINFNERIRLDDISFSYDKKTKNVLDKMSLVIPKGAKIAFVGGSGSGKSTLVDLIIGIYKPEEGKIIVDNTCLSSENIRDWRKKIGYIPQSIYLFDGTAAQNVVFGREYDEKKIVESLKRANIYDFLMQKDGIETKVGEGGIKLSIGQKQRIGIGRALYGDPEVLVLDEATSALDYETEAKIMEEIYSIAGDKTLLVIAHRLSTIKGCELVYTINDGKIEKITKNNFYDNACPEMKTNEYVV
jgi:ATP-binding cassette subfamily B protein/ATP-binding cassette subfamily C protein